MQVMQAKMTDGDCTMIVAYRGRALESESACSLAPFACTLLAIHNLLERVSSDGVDGAGEIEEGVSIG